MYMGKIMCFGTFDKLHKGHLSYFRQARKYGDYLIVVVARDRNVEKIKGKLPCENEKKRLKKIDKINFVDKAVLGQLRNRYNTIKKYEPDIICLGYDQEADIERLRKFFKGKVIRLKPFKENIYKSSKIVTCNS